MSDQPQVERGDSFIVKCPLLVGKFSYPPDIRKTIYTTNAIETLNNVIRAAIKKRKVFPKDDPVRKVFFLAI